MSGSRCLFTPAVLLVGVLASSSFAGLWCESMSTNPSVLQMVVCDDFDRYCVSPPDYPARCANGSTPDQTPFLLNWPEVAFSGNPMKVHDEYKAGTDPPEPLYADSWPFSLRYYSGANPDAGNYYLDTQHNRDLRSSIANLDPNMDMVNGTDTNPLVLEFVFHFHDEGRQYYQSQYVDLSLNTAERWIGRRPTIYRARTAPRWAAAAHAGLPDHLPAKQQPALAGFCPR